MSESVRPFWRDALAWTGSVTPKVLPRVLVFAVYALLVGIVHRVLHWDALESGPVQFTGGVLVLLLVLRTNGGYDRWWEGRKLWGGIVNQSRNLALTALSYGPPGRLWRERLVRWAAAFSHASRQSLRGERIPDEFVPLLGEDGARAVVESRHMPSFVARRLGALLQEGSDAGMVGFGFFAAERERAQLLDHLGGCERILKTPLPLVHSIKVRRFIVLYLAALPFALSGNSIWFPPFVTLLVSYPLLAIDQIGQELQNPFPKTNLSHLPLNEICHTIETDLLAMLEAEVADAPSAVHREAEELHVQ